MGPKAKVTPMDNTDPNLMVTIAATQIGKLTFPNDNEEWGRTSPAAELKNGLGDKETDNRICAVLEAIACLSVSSDKMQVVAVALQINPMIEEAIITIAENTTVSPRLIEHIVALLDGLHATAEEYEALSTEDKKSHSSKSTFPTGIIAMKNKLLKAVYRYSILKNLRRYNKWIPRLRVFLKLLEAGSHEIPNSDAILETLESTYTGLQSILGDKKDGTGEFTSKEWEALINAMDTIIPVTDAFCVECEKYAKPPSAGAWEVEIKQAGAVKGKDKVQPSASKPEDGIETFPVRHAIGKLTSQHRYMRNLFNDATSSSLRPLFLRKITVRAVPKNNAVPIILPRDPAELKSIVESTYDLINPGESKHVINRLINSMSPNFKVLEETAKSADGVVHCECSLVAYLEGIGQKIAAEEDKKIREEMRNIEPAPFNYLGVSKLSCAVADGLQFGQ